MTDLRALLGECHATVTRGGIEDACGKPAAGWAKPSGDETHPWPACAYHLNRWGGMPLTAVLPDLLAEANARANEAEAKARRFANLLGNNAKTLNDALPREVLRQKAAAWDEGYTRGFYDREQLSPDMPGRDASEGATPNPYRQGAAMHVCTHHWQNVGDSRTRYCARCGTEWTEAGA